MTTILKQISIAFGAMIFILVAVIGVVIELPVLVIFFRGIIAMSFATVIFLAFASFFQRLLYRFVAEQIMLQKGVKDTARRQERRRMPGLESGDVAMGGASGASEPFKVEGGLQS